MNNYIIIGGGLTGLSCAFKLILMEVEPEKITIYEARQEIGSPTRSPGIGKKSKNLQLVIDNILFQPLTKLFNNDNYFTFRREWFEKSILIHLTNLGCSIKLKNTVKNNLVIDSNTVLINCAGKKMKSSGFPGDFTDFSQLKRIIEIKENKTYIPWYGFLTINSFNIKNNNDIFSILKTEDYYETWTKINNFSNFKNKGLIEVMKSSFPEELNEIFANKTIDRGFLLANMAINNRG